MIKACDPVPFPDNLAEKEQHMLDQTFVRKGVIAWLRRSPLGPHLDHFATSLHHEGYAARSIQDYVSAPEKFAQWLQGQGHAVCEMDDDLVRTYRSGLARSRGGNQPKAAQGLGHPVRFLRHQGVTCPRHDAPVTPPLEQWVQAYDAHLEHVAGLALRTRQGYGPLVRGFLTACFGTEPPDWSALTAASITTFVSQQATRRRNAGRKQPAVAVRSFLRFLVFRGDCSKVTGFIQPVHDEVRRGFVDGLRLGLRATCLAPSAHRSGLACAPGRCVFASCDSADCPAPPHSRSQVTACHRETSGL